MLLGIDVGGTFTDFVRVDDAGRIHLHKRLTSPADPARSVGEGVAELDLPADALVVHGSTIATNALLERRGARTALITTRGFADVLEIGRQDRPDLYALVPRKPPPLIPREWRFEVDERVTSGGEILIPLAPQAIASLVPHLQAAQIESVAVCLLFSFLRPEHEQLVKQVLDSISISISTSISSSLIPEYREYERASTTAVNAYVAPLVDRYLAQLERTLAPRPLRIMQSNGGCITSATARAQAARTALSGPAGGVVGAMEVARQTFTEEAPGEGSGAIITFDMGGTSTDVCLCPGHIPFTSEGEIAGLPLRLPLIDIHTVGAGGGSLGRIDAGGALVVGPESAGADPGPACYGRGGQAPTVTDANLLLGRLSPGRFLGGRMALDEAAARAALSRLDTASPEQAAWGVLQVANAAMERAIRRISVERGFDPADFTLVAFGGAGPLHACELAERLGIPRVLVPHAPGVLSALGMLLADLVKDYSLTIMRPAGAVSLTDLRTAFGPLEARARAEMAAEGFSSPLLENSVDARYRGQSFEINVPLPAGLQEIAPLLEAFHARHARRYGHAHPSEPVEWVTLRVRATGSTPKPAFQPLAGVKPGTLARRDESIETWFDSPAGPQRISAGLYERARLLAGHRVDGPAVIVQMDATAVLPPGWTASVHPLGHCLASKH